MDIKFEKINIINNGFPITFKGNRIESKPEEMEKTICLLFSGVLASILKINTQNGFVEIPEDFMRFIKS